MLKSRRNIVLQNKDNQFDVEEICTRCAAQKKNAEGYGDDFAKE